MKNGITIAALAVVLGVSVATLLDTPAEAQSRVVTVNVADITIHNITIYPLSDGGCQYEVRASHPDIAVQTTLRTKSGTACTNILTLAAKAAALDARLDAGQP